MRSRKSKVGLPRFNAPYQTDMVEDDDGEYVRFADAEELVMAVIALVDDYDKALDRFESFLVKWHQKTSEH